MHNAPAVTYPVGRSHFQAGLTLAVGLTGALAQGAWWLLADAPGPIHGLGWLLWLVFCSWALWGKLHTPRAQLVWDGQDWRLQVGVLDLLVTPQVILDVQHSLLLCLRPEDGPVQWVWPAQKTHPARWLALRRALFHSAAQPDPSRSAGLSEV